MGVCSIKVPGCLKMAGFLAGAALAPLTPWLRMVLQWLNFAMVLKKLGGMVLGCL
jgi:hypothetical protein